MHYLPTLSKITIHYRSLIEINLIPLTKLLPLRYNKQINYAASGSGSRPVGIYSLIIIIVLTYSAITQSQIDHRRKA